MKIVIRNDFTGRQITVDASKPISLKKLSAWRRKLHCLDCMSGDDLGGRGPQDNPEAYKALLLKAQRLIICR
jgi:hypothetical protein